MTAVVVAIVLVVLCGFLALSLETGHLLSVRGELQNGADAAALAGARRLTGTNDDFELAGARTDAFNYARSHPTDRWDVEPSVVELGAWTSPEDTCSEVGGAQHGEAGPDGYRFCAIPGTTAADAANVNAVRVIAARQGAPGSQGGGAVELPFGAFVGQSAPAAVTAEAIAVTGGPCDQGCPELPFVVKESCVKPGAEIECGKLLAFGLGSSGIDSAGLTAFVEDSSGWGPQDVCRVLDDACTSRGSLVNRFISIKNGTNVGSECQGETDKICCEIRSRVGLVAQVPLVELHEGETCAGGFSDFNYVGYARIKGFGSVKLVAANCDFGGCARAPCPDGTVAVGDVATTGKGACVIPGYEGATADCIFANKHCFVMEFSCDEQDDDETTVGCGWYGTSPLQPVLVR